jgi:hypothetical protein
MVQLDWRIGSDGSMTNDSPSLRVRIMRSERSYFGVQTK